MTARSRPGYFRQEINKTIWEVPDRYKDLKQVGTGAYGTVCYALDRRTGAKVAIKKLHRPFQSDLFAKRAYRELRLLKHMKHDNVIGLVDVFTADLSLDRFHDFYLVMPFMGTDLGKLMKMERLSEERVQYLVYQMLKGLKYIHAAGIIHRDLKPGNLAINEECELKILDFGLARQTDSEMTGYVVTRWYRAPEVILSWMHYTQTVDIWSVGCIMAEMLLGKPLFKGHDHLDQLMEIMKVTGTPSKEFTAKLQSEDARNYVTKLPRFRKKDLRILLPNVNPQAIKVLDGMLLLDPESRITAAEALAFPFFSEFREPEEETEAPPYDHSLDEADQSLEQWKRLTFTEILTFQPAPAVAESKETAL
uniref:Mitogen-activated protein kinase 12 n=2 Tax=Danio rerio TaxID=7955 RepID=MK12_DANRE|nr:RecName: Full=Mitogen-activated protein kinase 12; Short=MAP kinase 12; Short=MAPK 12; AltName: Full=Stress-activated protein kinase 3 [Danio rerio]ABC94476.1 extracellular signal-regulated kinase 6 [Danio rerio]CAA75355.1 stress-activated protein kinase-3 [Danio rerio]